jgi:hypothetical protein
MQDTRTLTLLPPSFPLELAPPLASISGTSGRSSVIPSRGNGSNAITPARHGFSGSAGAGGAIEALRRAARLARMNPDARV